MSAWFSVVLLLAALPAQAQAPQRIVAIGGAITEIVYALGAEDRLVAVDSTSTYPPAVGALPDVGYMRRLSAEPIIALQPDAVLVIAGAGPPTALQQLRAAGVRVIDVPNPPSPDGVLAKIRTVADALGQSAQGEQLATQVARAFDTSRSVVERYDGQPRVLFLMSVGSGAPLAAGTGTEAASIIALAGARNAVTGFDGYKPLTPEAAVAAAPDVVLIGQRSLDALGGRAALAQRPEIAATPAGRNQRIVAMDMLRLLGFGPRTPAVVRDLAERLHRRAAD